MFGLANINKMYLKFMADREEERALCGSDCSTVLKVSPIFEFLALEPLKTICCHFRSLESASLASKHYCLQQ